MVVIYREVQRTFDIKHNNLWVIVQSTKTILQTTTSDCATNSGHGVVDATGPLDQRFPCPYCIRQLGSSGKRVHLHFYPFHYATIFVLSSSTGSSRKHSREGILAWCRTLTPKLYLYTWGLQWTRQPWEFLCVLVAPFFCECVLDNTFWYPSTLSAHTMGHHILSTLIQCFFWKNWRVK